jgi:hypothetical protein
MIPFEITDYLRDDELQGWRERPNAYRVSALAMGCRVSL